MTAQPSSPAGPVTSSPPVAHPLVVRTVAIDDLEAGPTALLDLLPDTRPLVWVRRGDGLVGWGTALRFETWGPGRFADAEVAWQQTLDRAIIRDEVGMPGTGPVAFGSFAFDDTSPDDLRPGGALIVPRVLVGRREGRSWMTTVDAAGSLATTPHTAKPTTRLPVTGPGTVSWREGALSADDWADVVREAVDVIRAGQLDKVVLARDVLARTSAPVDPRWLLRRLAVAYDTCWTFSVDGMIGATPELLVRSERGLVTSRVLAGTIPRGHTDDASLLHAAQLARSSKDLEEHEYAVASVADALAGFCTSMNVPDAPFVLHLPNVMHLASDVTGVLARPTPGVGEGVGLGVGAEREAGAEEGVSAGQATGSGALGSHGPTSLTLAAALHPSAAVCGTPTVLARDLIRKIEGMDRGRYAGPVGWLGSDGDGEWGIALRSAELPEHDDHLVRIFAGCGIVAASDPAVELAESEAKLEPLRYALGG